MDKKIANWFEHHFPTATAQNWDNVGLLIPSCTSGSKILITVDLTPSVIQECLELKINHIISYHSFIFPHLKKLNINLLKVVSNNMSVYCPHTTLDNFLCNVFSEHLFLNILYENQVSVFGNFFKTTNGQKLVKMLMCDDVLQSEGCFRIVYPFGMDKKKFNSVCFSSCLVGVGASQNEFKDFVLFLNERREFYSNLLDEYQECSVQSQGFKKEPKLPEDIIIDREDSFDIDTLGSVQSHGFKKGPKLSDDSMVDDKDSFDIDSLASDLKHINNQNTPLSNSIIDCQDSFDMDSLASDSKDINNQNVISKDLIVDDSFDIDSLASDSKDVNNQNSPLKDSIIDCQDSFDIDSLASDSKDVNNENSPPKDSIIDCQDSFDIDTLGSKESRSLSKETTPLKDSNIEDTFDTLCSDSRYINETNLSNDFITEFLIKNLTLKTKEESFEITKSRTLLEDTLFPLKTHPSNNTHPTNKNAHPNNKTHVCNNTHLSNNTHPNTNTHVCNKITLSAALNDFKNNPKTNLLKIHSLIKKHPFLTTKDTKEILGLESKLQNNPLKGLCKFCHNFVVEKMIKNKQIADQITHNKTLQIFHTFHSKIHNVKDKQIADQSTHNKTLQEFNSFHSKIHSNNVKNEQTFTDQSTYNKTLQEFHTFHPEIHNSNVENKQIADQSTYNETLQEFHAFHPEIHNLDVNNKQTFNDQLFRCIKIQDAAHLPHIFNKRDIIKMQGMYDIFFGKNKYNLLITGEMRHHDMLFYQQNKTIVVLLEHSRIERYGMNRLAEFMRNTFDEVYVSKRDRDPVSFVKSEK